MTTLSKNQIEAIQQAYLNGQFFPDYEVQRLVDAGISKDTATREVEAAVQLIRAALFQKTQKQVKDADKQEGLFIIVILINIFGPVFNMDSILWYAFAVIVSAVVGYFAYKEKPIAGVISAIIFSIIFPMAYVYYFSGRSTIINLEIAIPMLMAAVPAFIVYLLIAKSVYSNKEV
jgi:hypothetical protein